MILFVVAVEAEHHFAFAVGVEGTQLDDGLAFGVVFFVVLGEGFGVDEFGRESCGVVGVSFVGLGVFELGVGLVSE